MVALEHIVTIYGCSGGPIAFWPLLNSQLPPPFWSLADPDVQGLWPGGYTGSSTIRVPVVDVSLAAAALVALHRGGPEEREWPLTQ